MAPTDVAVVQSRFAVVSARQSLSWFPLSRCLGLFLVSFVPCSPYCFVLSARVSSWSRHTSKHCTTTKHQHPFHLAFRSPLHSHTSSILNSQARISIVRPSYSFSRLVLARYRSLFLILHYCTIIAFRQHDCTYVSHTSSTGTSSSVAIDSVFGFRSSCFPLLFGFPHAFMPRSTVTVPIGSVLSRTLSFSVGLS